MRSLRLLAEGKDYFHFLRASDTLPREKVTEDELLELRALDPAVARFPCPAARGLGQEWFQLSTAADQHLYVNPVLVERGAEVALEVMPGRRGWTFAKRETQYIVGGTTRVQVELLHGDTQVLTVRLGDVIAVPAGSRFELSPADADQFPHAQVFLTNTAEDGQDVHYDVMALLRLRHLGVVSDAILPAPAVADVRSRVRLREWSQLLTSRSTGFAPPTWLRNGWSERETARALDYAEGTRRVVVSAPDREPGDYIGWGSGRSHCWINPLIAEATCAVTDCRLPEGYARGLPAQELWGTLLGSATLSVTHPPLHSDASSVTLEPGQFVVVPSGSRVSVITASDDFVVRRHASSCARNGHWAMMELKLRELGLDRAKPTD